jgi:hypothetical protein
MNLKPLRNTILISFCALAAFSVFGQSDTSSQAPASSGVLLPPSMPSFSPPKAGTANSASTNSAVSADSVAPTSGISSDATPVLTTPATPAATIITTNSGAGTAKLDLKALTQNDTKDPAVIRQRESIIQDSLTVIQTQITSVRAQAKANMPALAPKGEFERSQDYDARKAKWENEANAKASAQLAPLQIRENDYKQALQVLSKNAAALKGSITLQSQPSGATVSLNGKQLGKTPLSIPDYWPGSYEFTIQAAGYLPYTQSVALQASKKVKTMAYLQKQFAPLPEGEINISALLQKSADANAISIYTQRLAQVEQRQNQVKEHYQNALAQKTAQYPALTPKGEFERQQDFDARKKTWEQGKLKLTSGLNEEYEPYLHTLSKVSTVLNDYIVQAGATPKTLTLPGSVLGLENYNADKELYPFILTYHSDSLQANYQGNLFLPLAKAKELGKNTADFSAQIQYYNIPAQYQGNTFYPALKDLALTHKSFAPKYTGSFVVPPLWKDNASIQAALLKADSIQKGLIRPQNLDIAFVYSGQKARQAYSGPSALRISQVILGIAGTSLFAYAYTQHNFAQDKVNNYAPTTRDEAVSLNNSIEQADKRRNLSIAGGSAVFSILALTFVF